ncbi:hypothetical protein GGI25_004343 [Coemansia spiralis]|uniref:Uncharacterized protein n=2 Tax=Coemansia TaxID=4863 RepID=A0A9W8KX93_9FUNG|nr:hypothetical protein EDC05_003061 [Coemansia umbellata]KAJ2621428.1 hypothetical protein GGI26_004110 [Coemansia sp. RSA 1358]KAJ2674403.1 hypothetical protein GGI25_004343 [Coemansia spiralis]
MPDGPRVRAERERQAQETRKLQLLATLGIGAALMAGIMFGHRRALRQATADHSANWPLRALGFGTLYAVTFVGMSATAGAYFLETKGISNINGFSQQMQSKAQSVLGSMWMRRKMQIDEDKDREEVERIDQLVSEPDERTGEKKIRFSRVKRLLGDDEGGGKEEEVVGSGPKSVSFGARMRAAAGFGKKKSQDGQNSQD